MSTPSCCMLRKPIAECANPGPPYYANSTRLAAESNKHQAGWLAIERDVTSSRFALTKLNYSQDCRRHCHSKHKSTDYVAERRRTTVYLNNSMSPEQTLNI